MAIYYYNGKDEAIRIHPKLMPAPFQDNEKYYKINNEGDAIDNENYESETQLAVEVDLLRGERNGRLSEEDWTQLEDSPLSSEVKTNFTIYRRALREAPSSISTWDDLKAFEWPDRPNET